MRVVLRRAVLEGYKLPIYLLGTFAPFRLASERPIAIACFLLAGRFPLLPLFKLPCFSLCIARPTDFCAAFPYRGIDSSFYHALDFAAPSTALLSALLDKCLEPFQIFLDTELHCP
jgi:hypothetical protein